MKTLNDQNYSNFKVFLVDDNSDDKSSEWILQQVAEKYHRLSNRMTIIQNTDTRGALANRDIVIRNYCSSGDIVV